MKSLQAWFNEYAVSHQNETNIKVHLICVPAIFFSIVGLFLCIPSAALSFLPHPILANWAVIMLSVILVFFYFRLSLKLGMQMLLFSVFCLVANYTISQQIPLLWFSIILFVLAWIGQFYGHKIEGKKPSFIKDLLFLLVGPAWVIHKIFR
jgi:uncharacterized membrane protein YGL010W